MKPGKGGKELTRGQKQIYQENQETLTYYYRIFGVCNVTFIALTVLFFWTKFTIWPIFSYMFQLSCSSIALYAMKKMSVASFNGNQLLDAGIDLNMKQGLAEHLKDVILFCAIITTLSIFSNYFWLLIFVIPGYAFYLLWVNILGPWFFAPAQEDATDEKKMKKLEKKKKRIQQIR